MNDYDRDHIAQILRDAGGRRYDWFTCHLFRLIAKPDPQNRGKLPQVYPEEVAAVLEYLYGTRQEVTS